MYFVQFFQFFALSLNFCLCLDIVLTLKAPFEPANRRGKWYVTVSAIVATFLAGTTQRNLELSNQWTLFNQLGEGVLTCVVIQAYILMAAGSSAYATNMMKRPGMSRSVRKRFINNHNWSIGIYTLTWIFYLGQSYYTILVCSFEGSNWSLDQL